MIVPVVLGFYFLVCISVVLFNCWKILSGKLLQRRLARWKQDDHLWFWDKAAHYPALSAQQQQLLVRQKVRTLRTNDRLLAFHAAMDEIEAVDAEMVCACMPLLAQIMQQLYSRCAGRASHMQAYYSYLITRFQVMRYAPSEQLTTYLLTQVREAESIYNLENALRAIYSSAQVSLVLKALRTLDGEDGIFLHEKLLVEGLLTFPEREALIAALWEEFSQFGAPMQELLLDYIRFASGAWRDKMLELLERTQELEVRLSCLRYFGKYPDARVQPMLYSLGRQTDAAQWELCAVSMSVLAAYPGDETVEVLKQGLRSRNWYVRYNAALSLRALHVSPEQVQDILSGDDRYAREMLQYRLEQRQQAHTPGEKVPV